MINTILTVLCAVFDISILIIYLESALPVKRENIPFIFRWGGYIAAEGILFILTLVLAGEYSTMRRLFTVFLGVLTTFVLTFYYYATIKYRILLAVLFQVVLALTEITSAYFIIPFMDAVYLDGNIHIDGIVLMASKFIAWVFVIILKIWWSRRGRNYAVSYNLLILVTPLISLFLLLLIPYPAADDQIRNIEFILIFGGLFLINIVDYYLLDNIFQVMKLREHESQLVQQIDFQTYKYRQISSAYRNTQRILHDTKKHYFYIQNCIDRKEYDKVNSYLLEAIQDLEQSYSCINTGNLVIDAFVSSCLEMAKQENIVFDTNIQILAGQVPISDYDLCIILGNLLDNSMNACRNISGEEEKRIEIEIFTSSLEFVIHIKNSMPSQGRKKKPGLAEELHHGFGVANIRKFVEKYSGTYANSNDGKFYETIIVIPLCFGKGNTEKGTSI